MRIASLWLRRLGYWRLMSLIVLFVSGLCLFTSCGDDDKETTIEYYVEVEEQFLVNGSKDGTKMYPNPIQMMQEAIKQAYPTMTQQGNDEAVIAACDKAYHDYVILYEGFSEDNLTALIHLMRGTRSDGLIRERVNLRTYEYNINYHPEE